MDRLDKGPQELPQLGGQRGRVLGELAGGQLAKVGGEIGEGGGELIDLRQGFFFARAEVVATEAGLGAVRVAWMK